MKHELLDQMETLLTKANDKDDLLKALVVRNSENLFKLISEVKLCQTDGYFFGVLHSQYSDVIDDPCDFVDFCSNYQAGDTVSGRDFYDDFKEALRDEIDQV